MDSWRREGNDVCCGKEHPSPIAATKGPITRCTRQILVPLRLADVCGERALEKKRLIGFLIKEKKKFIRN